jgi:hypothetical protein
VYAPGDPVPAGVTNPKAWGEPVDDDGMARFRHLMPTVAPGPENEVEDDQDGEEPDGPDADEVEDDEPEQPDDTDGQGNSDEDAPPPRPRVAASKDDWVAYVLAVADLDETEVRAMKKADLIDLVSDDEADE